ncbi:MAG: Holliday junction ATP-dependent DNA helicase RuvA [Planctomycetota bacterium]|nr:Holliday junction ATP-dependent DNA helicase RuvA [Planctomycetota bacterium]
MYNHIAGTLDAKTPSTAVIDVGGVGYVLRIPLSTAGALPNVGQRARLFAYLHYTQDGLTLYGFGSEGEREFFLQLMTVSGVGPKLALAVLGGGRVQDIQQAIRLGDYATLKRIKGVGESTAKKIVLELGKILVHQVDGTPEQRRARAAGGPVVAPGLDADTDLAVKAVVQLQQVPPDVALQAVQRAFAELSAVSSERPVVQEVVQRALRYTG